MEESRHRGHEEEEDGWFVREQIADRDVAAILNTYHVFRTVFTEGQPGDRHHQQQQGLRQQEADALQADEGEKERLLALLERALGADGFRYLSSYVRPFLDTSPALLHTMVLDWMWRSAPSRLRSLHAQLAAMRQSRLPIEGLAQTYSMPPLQLAAELVGEDVFRLFVSMSPSELHSVMAMLPDEQTITLPTASAQEGLCAMPGADIKRRHSIYHGLARSSLTRKQAHRAAQERAEHDKVIKRVAESLHMFSGCTPALLAQQDQATAVSTVSALNLALREYYQERRAAAAAEEKHPDTLFPPLLSSQQASHTSTPAGGTALAALPSGPVLVFPESVAILDSPTIKWVLVFSQPLHPHTAPRTRLLRAREQIWACMTAYPSTQGDGLLVFFQHPASREVQALLEGIPGAGERVTWTCFYPNLAASAAPAVTHEERTSENTHGGALHAAQAPVNHTAIDNGGVKGAGHDSRDWTQKPLDNEKHPGQSHARSQPQKQQQQQPQVTGQQQQQEQPPQAGAVQCATTPVQRVRTSTLSTLARSPRTPGLKSIPSAQTNETAALHSEALADTILQRHAGPRASASPSPWSTSTVPVHVLRERDDSVWEMALTDADTATSLTAILVARFLDLRSGCLPAGAPALPPLVHALRPILHRPAVADSHNHSSSNGSADGTHRSGRSSKGSDGGDGGGGDDAAPRVGMSIGSPPASLASSQVSSALGSRKASSVARQPWDSRAAGEGGGERVEAAECCLSAAVLLDAIAFLVGTSRSLARTPPLRSCFLAWASNRSAASCVDAYAEKRTMKQLAQPCACKEDVLDALADVSNELRFLWAMHTRSTSTPGSAGAGREQQWHQLHHVRGYDAPGALPQVMVKLAKELAAAVGRLPGPRHTTSRFAPAQHLPGHLPARTHAAMLPRSKMPPHHALFLLHHAVGVSSYIPESTLASLYHAVKPVCRGPLHIASPAVALLQRLEEAAACPFACHLRRHVVRVHVLIDVTHGSEAALQDALLDGGDTSIRTSDAMGTASATTTATTTAQAAALLVTHEQQGQPTRSDADAEAARHLLTACYKAYTRDSAVLERVRKAADDASTSTLHTCCTTLIAASEACASKSESDGHKFLASQLSCLLDCLEQDTPSPPLARQGAPTHVPASPFVVHRFSSEDASRYTLQPLAYRLAAGDSCTSAASSTSTRHVLLHKDVLTHVEAIVRREKELRFKPGRQPGHRRGVMPESVPVIVIGGDAALHACAAAVTYLSLARAGDTAACPLRLLPLDLHFAAARRHDGRGRDTHRFPHTPQHRSARAGGTPRASERMSGGAGTCSSPSTPVATSQRHERPPHSGQQQQVPYEGTFASLGTRTSRARRPKNRSRTRAGNIVFEPNREHTQPAPAYPSPLAAATATAGTHRAASAGASARPAREHKSRRRGSEGGGGKHRPAGGGGCSCDGGDGSDTKLHRTYTWGGDLSRRGVEAGWSPGARVSARPQATEQSDGGESQFQLDDDGVVSTAAVATTASPPRGFVTNKGCRQAKTEHASQEELEEQEEQEVASDFAVARVPNVLVHGADRGGGAGGGETAAAAAKEGTGHWSSTHTPPAVLGTSAMRLEGWSLCNGHAGGGGGGKAATAHWASMLCAYSAWYGREVLEAAHLVLAAAMALDVVRACEPRGQQEGGDKKANDGLEQMDKAAVSGFTRHSDRMHEADKLARRGGASDQRTTVTSSSSPQATGPTPRASSHCTNRDVRNDPASLLRRVLVHYAHDACATIQRAVYMATVHVGSSGGPMAVPWLREVRIEESRRGAAVSPLRLDIICRDMDGTLHKFHTPVHYAYHSLRTRSLPPSAGEMDASHLDNDACASPRLQLELERSAGRCVSMMVQEVALEVAEGKPPISIVLDDVHVIGGVRRLSFAPVLGLRSLDSFGAGPFSFGVGSLSLGSFHPDGAMDA